MGGSPGGPESLKVLRRSPPVVTLAPMSRTVTFDRAPPPGTVNFGVGQPSADLLPVELMRAAAEDFLRQAQPQELNYGPPVGDARFLESLAVFLTDGYGTPVDPSSLFVRWTARPPIQHPALLIKSRQVQPGSEISGPEVEPHSQGTQRPSANDELDGIVPEQGQVPGAAPRGDPWTHGYQSPERRFGRQGVEVRCPGRFQFCEAGLWMGKTSQSVEDEKDDLPSFHTSLDLSVGKADVGHGLVRVQIGWLGGPGGLDGSNIRAGTGVTNRSAHQDVGLAPGGRVRGR